MKKNLLIMTVFLLTCLGAAAQGQKITKFSPKLDVRQSVMTLPQQNVKSEVRKNVAASKVASTPVRAKRAAGDAPSDLAVKKLGWNSAMITWEGDFDSYNVRYRKASEASPSEGAVFFESFDDGVLPEGWTTIDADGDGEGWEFMTGFSDYAHSGDGLATSASYINYVGPLEPDNWLITPLLDLEGTMKVWMYGQDPKWAAEHFAAYLYIPAEGDDEELTADDFKIELIKEKIVTGEYVQYEANLSEYEGQKGYIAIRHFNCTDMYRLNLDDFGIYTEETGGEWTELSTEENSIELTDLDAGTTYELQVQGNAITNLSDWSPLLQFTTIADNLWYFNGYNNDDEHIVNQEITVDIYPENHAISITGLCSYLPDAAVTGKLSEDGKTATFESGQYFGSYNNSYDMYFLGYNLNSESEEDEIIDVVFDVDLDNGVLTLDENTLIVVSAYQNKVSYYEYYYDVVITHDQIPYAPPTDLEVGDITTNSAMLTWTDNSIEEVTQWVVKYSPLVVTSVDENGNKTYDLAEDGTLLQEIVVDDDAYTLEDLEPGTAYVVWVRPEPAEDMWSDYLIFETKVIAVPGVPADPTDVDWYDKGDESGYSYVSFTLPEYDVDGNQLDKELLSYSIYTDNDQLFTFDADTYYNDIEEDMTEIPYSVFNGGYDFYTNHVYFYRTNEGDNPFFTKRIGVQVHYTVDGEKNSSNIVYYNLPIPTGIDNATVSEGNDTWYTLDGRKLSSKPSTKGVFIRNKQKVVNK